MHNTQYKIEYFNKNIYIPHLHFKDNLKKELTEYEMIYEDMLSAQNDNNILWAQDIWKNVFLIQFDSIKQAVQALKSFNVRWVLHSVSNHRRASLIEEQLPKIKIKRLPFPSWSGYPKFGCWSLIDKNTILCSTECFRNRPLGIYEFEENKTFAPNRAYLKLWEVFTSIDKYPKENDIALDLGSSPGGWTWVLQTLGCKVISIDKAPLNDNISSLPNIDFRNQSAFALEPKEFDKIDWFCSDIICYPDKLFTHISKWVESGKCKNFICTIKFQGEPDYKSVNDFLSIPYSQVIHLYQNKNEMTWIKLTE